MLISKKQIYQLLLFTLLVVFAPSLFQDDLIPADASGLLTVTKVVDGDTIKVDLNGEEKTIRLIGVDTPETVDPRKPVECFGKEASEYLASLVEGKQVMLEADATQGDTDRYQRLLRYVYLPGEKNVNETIIRWGYGYEYTYKTPYRLQAVFQEAQWEAQNKKRGLWNPVKCWGAR